VYTDNSLATIGANAKIGIYGDLKAGYLVRTVGGIRADVSPDFAFLNDLVTWRFIMRADGDIIDNNAFTVITDAAS
jgi:HK97 family phage major capsid protein